MTAALTSFRISFVAVLALRALSVCSGALLSPILQHQPALTHARPAPSAMAILTNNLEGTAVVGVLSAATGGVAGLLFTLADGVRYGLTVSGGTVDAPARGLPAQLAAIGFPWLEFISVSAVAAGASVLFWRLWFGWRPVVRIRHAFAIVVATTICLVTAAELEAWLLR
jgi:hypothetical protein